jgi:hypothetical protein
MSIVAATFRRGRFLYSGEGSVQVGPGGLESSSTSGASSNKISLICHLIAGGFSSKNNYRLSRLLHISKFRGES